MQIELLYSPRFPLLQTPELCGGSKLERNCPSSLSLTRILAFGDATRNRGRRLTMSFLRTVENNIAQVGKPEPGSRVRGPANQATDTC